jgi:LysM repeat protein
MLERQTAHAKPQREIRRPLACQTNRPMPKFRAMRLLAIITIAGFFSLGCIGSRISAQPTPQTPASSDAAQIEALAKKIDAQNAKIDTLSQEILKLQQQIANIRPGVMIGEGAPSSPSSAAAVEPSRAPNGNTHIVTRGETLTSIAKTYKVGVDELQKFNHIEDGRKLQAGQTIQIPASPTPTPSASPPK